MTKLGFGFMRLPMKDDVIDIETTCKMVDKYIERGFTYFDTAWGYCKHTSENAIKTCVVKGLEKDSLRMIANKMHNSVKYKENLNKIIGNNNGNDNGRGHIDMPF